MDRPHIPDLYAMAADKITPNVLLWLAKEWGGFDDGRTLYADLPDAAAGHRRLATLLYLWGIRHPLLHVVSLDYLDWLTRFWRFQYPLDDGDGLQTVLVKMDLLPAGWPIHAMSGRAFQLMVAHLEQQGNVVQPRLARDVVPATELDRLFARARDVGITPAEMSDVLVDLGGGVFSERHLDQAGFDRIEVAIEAKVAGLWRPGDVQPKH